MLRTLLASLLLLGSTGCFVFDELEKGQEIMDAHTPKERREAEEAAAAAADAPDAEEGGGVAAMLDRAKDWWRDTTEPAPVERAPEDVAVRCELAGGMQFMRKSDCLVRGGRVL